MDMTNPKILFLDMPSGTEDVLLERGFNVSTGSLGTPYPVQSSSDFHAVVPNFWLPRYTETEVVVVDFMRDENHYMHKTSMELVDGQYYDYARANLGVVDPREFQVRNMKEDLDRCMKNGAYFVVFGHPRIVQQTIWARKSYSSITDAKANPVSLWRLNEVLALLEITPDEGEEMECSGGSSALDKLLEKHLIGGSFTCRMDLPKHLQSMWRPLISNKYGQTVGCILGRPGEGQTIVLPRLANIEEFIVNLFTDVLPEMAPGLFPFSESGKWLREREYEIPNVLSIKDEQDRIRTEADARIEELEQSIAAERSKHAWLHDLLSGTDSVLVNAVTNALVQLGFKSIVDVDEELDAKGKPRREDLQIQDEKHVLVVDVKGVAGGIADDHVLQAHKHATLRFREWRKAGAEYRSEVEDVSGLAIINHQRNTPPLSRENRAPFRDELLEAADEHGIGLLTAWDLYRLVRNKEKWDWASEVVLPLFYKKGRILPIPKQYVPVGTIAKAWTDKFGLILEGDELRVGDTIAIEFPIFFEEVQVESIHVEDQAVEKATLNARVGLLWPHHDHKLREGAVVYVVRNVGLAGSTEANSSVEP
jgi:hypothetical protein